MKRQKPIYRMLEWIISSSIFYCLFNVIIHYLILATGYSALAAKAQEQGKTLSMAEHFAFQVEYILKPIKDLHPSMSAMVGLMLGMFLVNKLDERYAIKYGNKDIKGDQHFLTFAELKKESETLSSDLYYFDASKPKSAKKSGIPIALSNGKMFICPSTTHSLIIGTTRSGKGQTYVNPMIRFIALSKAKHSIVANDPKGELVECEYDILKEQGYDVLIFNLRDTNKSSLWNPLQIIIDEYVNAMETDKDLSKVMKLVTSLAATFTDNPKSDPIWPDSARSLLIAMILLILERCYNEGCLEKVNMYTIYNFFIEFGTYNESYTDPKTKRPKEINALDTVFQNLPLGSPAKSAYATSNFAKGDMRSSIFSTLSSNINIFGADMGISKLTSANQIDFNRLIDPDKPCAIFMVVPDEDTSRHIIASLFVNQCYNSLVEQSSKFSGQKLPQRVHFILDEFGNMVRIPDMDTKITVGAGRELLFDLFVQDLNQLDTKYDNAAKTIRSNTGNVVYINSLDNDTNEYISKLLGNKTMEYSQYSGQLSEGIKSRSINVEGVPLMTAAELSEMKFGEAVIKRQRKMPIRTKFEPFYKLNIKPKPIDEMNIDIQNVSLSDVIYDFDRIWDEIGMKKDSDSEEIPTITKDSTPSTVFSQPKSQSDRAEEHNLSSAIKAGGAFTNAPKKASDKLEKEETTILPKRKSKDDVTDKINELSNGKYFRAYKLKRYRECMEFIEQYSDKLSKEECEQLYRIVVPLYEAQKGEIEKADKKPENTSEKSELVNLLEKVNGMSKGEFLNVLRMEDYEECYALIDKFVKIRKLNDTEYAMLRDYINELVSEEV